MTAAWWLLLAVAVGLVLTINLLRYRAPRPTSCTWHHCHANHDHTPHK